MKKYNLEISGIAAVAGLIGLVALSVFWPDSMLIAPAAICGFGVGMFHGVLGEMNRTAERGRR